MNQKSSAMRFTEILLIIVIVALLVLPPYIFNRIKEPFRTYGSIFIGLILLILVWFFTAEGSLPLRIIVTAVVIKNTLKSIQEYNEFKHQ